jgi:hypothetical protein
MEALMRVLFLDFDGVLNTRPFLLALFDSNRADPEVAAYQDRATSQIDPEKVALLNQIIEATHCTVVVSSSWRHYHNRHELQAILSFHGFAGYVWGVTPHNPELYERPRGLEIQEWIDGAPEPVSHFVILDDDDDMVHLKHRLVHTHVETGLTQEHVDRAIQMLKED